MQAHTHLASLILLTSHFMMTQTKVAYSLARFESLLRRIGKHDSKRVVVIERRACIEVHLSKALSINSHQANNRCSPLK